MGTFSSGLYYFDESKNEFQHISTNINIPQGGGGGGGIGILYKDNEGNIWAGTDKGISIFNPTFQQFRAIDDNSLINPFARSVTEYLKQAPEIYW